MKLERLFQVPDGPPCAGPYSLGVIAEGKFLHVAGQGPYCPEQKRFVRGSVEEQTELTLRNVERVVKAAGGSLENVVSCRVFLQQLTETNFQAMNGVYAKFFGDHKPARTTIGCQLLNIDVEIDAIVAL